MRALIWSLLFTSVFPTPRIVTGPEYCGRSSTGRNVQLTCKLVPGSESPHSLLSSEGKFHPSFLQWEPCSRTQPWEVKCCSRSTCDGTQLRPLYKLKILAEGEKVYLPYSFPQTVLCVSSFAYQTHHVPIRSDASSFSLSLPTTGPSLQTNK